MDSRHRSCILDCDIRGIPLHCFPHPIKKSALFTEWCTITEISLCNPMQTYETKRICSRHFISEYKTSGHRLVQNARPTLHLQGVPRSLVTIIEEEHDYFRNAGATLEYTDRVPPIPEEHVVPIENCASNSTAADSSQNNSSTSIGPKPASSTNSTTMVTLWKMDPSPPAYAVRAFAEILGLKLDLVDVDFEKREHKSPEFKKINPLGTLPVLKDGDFILSDSHAMNKYLLEKYGTAEQRESLYPSDLRVRALIDQAMFFDAAVFFIRLKVIYLPTVFEGLTGPTPKHLADIEEAYSVVEAYLGDKGYIATDRFTLADLSVGVTTASMQTYLKVDSKKFPNTAAWLTKLYQIPAFKKYCGFELLTQIMEDAWEANKLKQNKSHFVLH